MQKRLSHSAEDIYREREKIINVLRASVTGILKNHKSVLKVALFGSIARGDYSLYSDADILIILSESKYTRFFDRIPEFLDYFSNSDVPVDLFPYTSDEIERMKKNKNSFILRALKDCVDLS